MTGPYPATLHRTSITEFVNGRMDGSQAQSGGIEAIKALEEEI